MSKKRRIYDSVEWMTLKSGRKIPIYTCGPDHPIYKGGLQMFTPAPRPPSSWDTKPETKKK